MAPDVALRELAGRVAARLVAEALNGMIGTRADIVVSVTPKQLRAAPTPKRHYTRRAKSAKHESLKKPAAVTADLGIADRACRGCLKKGTAVRVAGTEKTVKCSACGHVWDVRAKYKKTNGHAGAAMTKAGSCGRCTHPKVIHEMGSGRCVEKNCVCREYYV